MSYRFIGYAIVSEDGMLADASGTIPPSLIVKADQDFFMRGLDAAAALVHGRNSAEQPTSPNRRRLIATRGIAATAPVTGQPNALHWNPKGVSVETALAELGVADGDVAIIGGTDIFGLFLPSYAIFHLTRVPNVTLPGGLPVFPRVPTVTPEALLTEAGLSPGKAMALDESRNVSVVSWQRS
ncbi:dihydrofolate reductase [Pseudorhodoplanes sp.]|uniref:dihydrofolate reductase family protein n=1 Tax=Pseudorhodoplanes sp. TaxID=1934341 RepID=UPI002CA18393|nr:dihydrofolate reductase [Pseudorhodoplanes sp.]HWV54001.1 dihydrofolate reductase [Pseudorhodoplanes sp.]